MRKNLRYTMPPAMILALSLALGFGMKVKERVFMPYGIGVNAILFVGLTAVFTLLFHGIYFLCDKYGCQSQDNTDFFIKKKWGFGTFFLIYTICYLPYFLSFFPGNCGKDTIQSLDMILGNIPWTNHHPILFTFIIMIFVKGTAFLGSLSLSVGIFTFFHMLLFAACNAYVTKRIVKGNFFFFGKILTVLFYAFHPFMGMYSIYLTKDVLFSIIMVFMTLTLFDMVKEGKAWFAGVKNPLKLALLFLLAALLRNNGIYIIFVMAVIMLLVYKENRITILCMFAGVLLFVGIYQGPVFQSMGIEKSSFRESVAIPLQQVAHVITDEKNTRKDLEEVYTKEGVELLETTLPFEAVKEVYTPGYVDPYKFHEDFNDGYFNENAGEFIRIWAKGIVPYFPEYVEAYLFQTAGYWHFYETNTVATEGVVENDIGLEGHDLIDATLGFSMQDGISFIIRVGRKLPGLRIFASMAMQMLAVLVFVMQTMRRKEKREIIPVIPLVILWATLMVATPAFCLLRYMFPLFLLWPVLIAKICKATL